MSSEEIPLKNHLWIWIPEVTSSKVVTSFNKRALLICIFIGSPEYFDVKNQVAKFEWLSESEAKQQVKVADLVKYVWTFVMTRH